MRKELSFYTISTVTFKELTPEQRAAALVHGNDKDVLLDLGAYFAGYLSENVTEEQAARLVNAVKFGQPISGCHVATKHLDQFKRTLDVQDLVLLYSENDDMDGVTDCIVGDRPTIEAQYVPQYIDSNGDAQLKPHDNDDDDTWDATQRLLSKYTLAELVGMHNDDEASDSLATDTMAPDWVAKHRGPFFIRIRKSLQVFFMLTTGKELCDVTEAEYQKVCKDYIR